MPGKEEEKEVVVTEEQKRNGQIPVSAILASLRKHQAGVEEEVKERDELERRLNLATFPSFGKEGEEAN
jgi:hypothetical protein